MDLLLPIATQAKPLVEAPEKYLAPSLLLASIVIITIFWTKIVRPKNFPPGPPCFPFVGSLLSFATQDYTRPHLILLKLSEKFGPVSGFFMGPRPCVAVNGFEAVKHVLSRDDCSFRPEAPIIRARSFHKRLGLFFSDGPLWKEQRRFTIRHLRDFGFGKRSIEGIIHEEVEAMIADLEERKKTTPNSLTKGINMMDLFPPSVVNILWAVMAGVRYEHSNEDFKMLMHLTKEFFRNTDTTGGPSATFPWLRFVPFFNQSYNMQLKSDKALQIFIRKTIDEHVTTYQEDNMRDFIDVFLREMKVQADNLDTTFTDEQLIVLCADMFLAGTETTSSTLAYMFLYFIVFPEWQVKVRDEINRVVGSRLPSVQDASELHITQAFIHEVTRHAGITLFMYHSTAADIELNGYSIPKNTTIIVNLYSVSKERSYWGDPSIFSPERFLDDNNRYVPDEHLIPFGHGPRICLGKALAKDTTLLFVTTLVQRFTFSVPSCCPPPSMDHLPGFATTPRPFTVDMQEV